MGCIAQILLGVRTMLGAVTRAILKRDGSLKEMQLPLMARACVEFVRGFFNLNFILFKKLNFFGFREDFVE